MPTVQEVIKRIKKDRGALFRKYGVTPQQHCDHIEDVVRDFPRDGQMWMSDDHRMADDYMTHCVGVVRVRGKSGVIVQFSGARQEDTAIVVGSVPDVTNEKKVAQALERHTRKTGWRRFTG